MFTLVVTKIHAPESIFYKISNRKIQKIFFLKYLEKIYLKKWYFSHVPKKKEWALIPFLPSWSLTKTLLS